MKDVSEEDSFYKYLTKKEYKNKFKKNKILKIKN